MLTLVIEGVKYNIPLDTLEVGESVFVPSLAPKEVIAACRRWARAFPEVRLQGRACIHDGFLGARVWRVP